MHIAQGLKLVSSKVNSDASLSHRLGRSRRRWERTAIDAWVEIFSPVAATGLALNISAGGVLVALSRPLTTNQICVLALEGQPEMARVAWCRLMDTGCFAGLEFVGDDDPAAYNAA